MAFMKVRPTRDEDGKPRRVPVPERGNKRLRADGETVPRSPYWWRRIVDGEVEEVTADAASTTSPFAAENADQAPETQSPPTRKRSSGDSKKDQ